MKIGNSDIIKAYRGATEITKVYRGASEVWTPPPSGGFVTTGLVYGWTAGAIAGLSNGDPVTEFTDQLSGLNNHSVQGSSGNRAIYRTNANGTGKPGVEFTYSNQHFYEWATPILSGATEGEIFLVKAEKNQNPAGQGGQFMFAENGTWMPYSNDDYYVGFGMLYVNFTHSSDETQNQIWNISTAASGNQICRVNGVTVDTSPAPGTLDFIPSASGIKQAIGYTYDGSLYYFDGYYFGILIYDRVLTGGERTQNLGVLATLI